MSPLFDDLSQTIAGKVKASSATSVPGSEPVPEVGGPHFPALGRFGPFRLIKPLGQGAEGRVFLALQPELSERPVVLKVAAVSLHEHLLLARLQHTNIVPLYGIHEDLQCGERALCMPYFGSVTLRQVLDHVAPIPPSNRRGQDLVQLLDQGQKDDPVPGECNSPTRAFLIQSDFTTSMVWLVACLADALHYAHERGLIHFDVKPSNILISADGQPMLLDFHLARGPLRLGDEAPAYFGGSPPFLAPEQEQACLDTLATHNLTTNVDRRADIYALGMVLLASLGGKPKAKLPVEELHRANPGVSVGLGDLIARCIAADPGKRYPTAGELAQDLRAHLRDEPLTGVRNRSWKERWRKWRRRRPFAMPLLTLLAALFLAVGVAAVAVAQHRQKQRREAEHCFFEGQEHLRTRRFEQAAQCFQRGLDLVEGWGRAETLAHSLDQHLQIAHRSLIADDLRSLVERLRTDVLVAPDSANTFSLRLAAQALWDRREELLLPSRFAPDPGMERIVQQDLTELAILWSEILVRENDQHSASQILAEASQFSPYRVVLELESNRLRLKDEAWSKYLKAQLLGTKERSAWDNYCLASSLLRMGNVQEASKALAASLELEPADFAANYAQGIVQLRLKQPHRAAKCLSVCVGLQPLNADCYLRRAVAFRMAKDHRAALADLNRALELRPHWADALRERGNVLLLLGETERAAQDHDLAKQIAVVPR